MQAATDGPLQLARLSRCCLLIEGATAGKNEGTMRGSDPVACNTIRAWRDAVRDKAAAWSAFAVPTETACQALVVIIVVWRRGLIWSELLDAAEKYQHHIK